MESNYEAMTSGFVPTEFEPRNKPVTALRSSEKPRYRDINTNFLRRVATAFSEGHATYERPYGMIFEKNYQQGDLTFALRALDHAIEHLLEYRDSVMDSLAGREFWEGEDHLGHAGANLSMLAWYEENGYWFPLNGITAPEDTRSYEEVAEPEPLSEEPNWKTKIKDALGL